METILESIDKKFDINFIWYNYIKIKYTMLKYQYKISIIAIITNLRENKNCWDMSKNQNYTLYH